VSEKIEVTAENAQAMYDCMMIAVPSLLEQMAGKYGADRIAAGEVAYFEAFQVIREAIALGAK